MKLKPKRPFKVGEIVRHKYYGYGEVKAITKIMGEKSYLVHFNGEDFRRAMISGLWHVNPKRSVRRK